MTPVHEGGHLWTEWKGIITLDNEWNSLKFSFIGLVRTPPDTPNVRVGRMTGSANCAYKVVSDGPTSLYCMAFDSSGRQNPVFALQAFVKCDARVGRKPALRASLQSGVMTSTVCGGWPSSRSDDAGLG